MTENSGENPASIEAPIAPERLPTAREDVQTLLQSVFAENAKETVELVQALQNLRGFVKSDDYQEPRPDAKKILLQAITDAMATLGDVKFTEQNPASTAADYQQALTALNNLNDASQNFLAIFRNPRYQLVANTRLTAVDNAFDEKIKALEMIKQNIEAKNFVPREAVAAQAAPAAAPTAAPTTPKVPATPEQTVHKEAVKSEVDASNAIYTKIEDLSAAFKRQMGALKSTIPNVPLVSKDDEARTSIDTIVTNFGTEKGAMVAFLKQADDLRKSGDFAGAKTAMGTFKTKFDTFVTNAEAKITEKLGAEGIKDEPQRVAILTVLQEIVVKAKEELPPLLATRTQTLDAVATAKTALDSTNTQPLEESIQVATLAQEPPAAPATPDAAPSDEEVASMTMDEFTDKLQTSWEKMGEALEGKKWGAVVGALVGMLGLIMARFKSLDSFEKWGEFFEGFGEEEAATPEATSEAAPEKPTTKEAVVAQFGIAETGAQQNFLGLKTSDIARFIKNNGAALAAGEPPYPQALVDFKANQGEAYGKLKQQLTFNGLTTYQEGLSAGDKPAKTLGDFIEYRLTADATKADGWKIA